MNEILFDAQEWIFNNMILNNYKFEEPNLMEEWDKYGFIKKDVLNGEELRVEELVKSDGNHFWLKCNNSLEIPCVIKKERRFFEMQGQNFNNIEDLIEWLNGEDAKEWFNRKKVFLSAKVNKGEVSGSLLNAFAESKREEFFDEIKDSKTVYAAKIIGKNVGGFLVDVEGVMCFLPGSLASANKIIDFDSFVGKKVLVMIEDYIREGDTFIVSNKKYIQHTLPQKIKKLDFNTKYSGEITGTSRYGIFIEWDDIFTGLLHISEMDINTKTKFNERKTNFHPGDIIEFYIKEIGKNNRIILSETDNSNKITYDDFKEYAESKVEEGTIVNIKPIGSFVQFVYKNTPFVGLLHHKEYPIEFEPKLDMKLNLYISKVDVESKKIFLKWDKTEKITY